MYSIASQSGSLDLESIADVTLTSGIQVPLDLLFPQAITIKMVLLILQSGLQILRSHQCRWKFLFLRRCNFYEELLTVTEVQGYGSKVYIFDGTNISSGGTFDSSQSDGSIFSEDSDALGTTLSTCDMNENGRDDLWLASPLYNGSDGRATLYLMDYCFTLSI